MTDSWMEPRTRIPFVGIVAMVLIVAVVAVFIKTQLAPFFPEATVSVEDETALTGKATSETFYGMREVDLYRKEVLLGSLSRKDGELLFTVDVEGQMLTVVNKGVEEQIVLYPRDGLLKARVEYNDINSIIVIDPPARSLTFGSEAAMPIDIGLTEAVIYTGDFTYKGIEYAVAFNPAASELAINKDRVPLTAAGKMYTGTWMNGRVSKPVTIDAAKELLTIEEVY